MNAKSLWGGIDLANFQKQQEESLAVNQIKEDPYIEFLGELQANGLDVHRVEITNKIKRVPLTNSRKRDKNGWYVFDIIDGVAFGSYGDWTKGSKISFRSDNYNKLSPSQRLEIDKKAKLIKEMREAERVEAMRLAKLKAQEDLRVFATCAKNYDHPYLVGKQVEAYGLYTDTTNIYIPIRDFSGDIVSYQFITPEMDNGNNKYFLKDGQIDGCYHFIQGHTKQWIFVEGYATGATIHKATGANVMVCFNAGNLYKVVKNYRNTTTDPIIIGADNDHKKPQNAGLDVANRIANDFTGVTIRYPEQIEGSVFNDLACEVGLDAVKRVFNSSQSLIEIIQVDEYDCAEPEWFIKGVLPKEKMILTFGPSGHMKSFMTLDMMLHLACGMDWCGHKVKQQEPVLYLCGEGASGVKRRVQAWKMHHNIDYPVPFFMTKAPVAMLEKDQTNMLIGAIQDFMLVTGLNRYPQIIIIDTLNRNFGGGDENSTKDMTAFIDSCNAVNAITGSTFYNVHHSGTAEAERARGSNALHAASDAVFKVSMTNYDKAKLGLEEPEIELKCVKMKDAQEMKPKLFASVIVYLGEDSDGDDITSVVLNYEGEAVQDPVKIANEELLSFLNKPVSAGKNKAEQYRLALKDAVLACVREVVAAEGVMSCFIPREKLHEVFMSYCERHDLVDGGAYRKQKARAIKILTDLDIIKPFRDKDMEIAVANSTVINVARNG